jgi:hypothetical protein
VTSRSARIHAHRGLSVVAALALALSLLVPGGQTPANATTCPLAASEYADGAGTEEVPYEISSTAELLHLAATSGDWNKHFVQTEEIDLDGCTWTTIGTFEGTAFTGSYDGQGTVIRNLEMSVDGPAGLFGHVGASGVLTDIHMVAVTLTVTGSASNRPAGGLVALNLGTVSASSSTGAIINAGTTGPSGLGGLVGRNEEGGTIRFSSSNVNIITAENAPPAQNVGGLVGRSSGDEDDPSASGGIEYSFATGSVAGWSNVGGLVGSSRDGMRILNSYARGAVTGEDDDEFNRAKSIAGLVGRAGESVTITNSYATGKVSTTPDGGRRGGLNAEDDPIVVASFWDTQTTEQTTSEGGVGKTTEEMKTLSTFSDWSIRATCSFDESPRTVWGICATENDGYPFLRGFTEEESESVLDDESDGENNGENGTTGPVEEESESAPEDESDGENGGENGTTGPVEEESESAAEDESESASGDEAVGENGATGSTPPGGSMPLLVDGAVPVVPTGTGVWVQADGTSVPLAVSSPAAGQVRYEVDGLQVTLTGAAGTSVANGLVATPNGEVECEICTTLATGGVIEAWMFSTPRLVAAWRVEDLPCQTFTIPVVAPLDGGGPVVAGAHTLQLALPTASGMQAINVGVTVGGLVPSSVPAGEGPVPFGAVLLALLAAAGVLVAGRRLVTAG